MMLTITYREAFAPGLYIDWKVPTCTCPDDCNCRYPWRTNYCGCRAH